MRNLLIALSIICTIPSTAQDSFETVFSTYFGGSGTDDCDAVAVDREGNSYLGCHLNSPAIPGSEFHQYALNGDMDAFIIKINTDSNAVEYIKHLGGSGWDAVLDLTVDEVGNVYAVGGTYSADFPVSDNSSQSLFGGQMDAFVVKLNQIGEVEWATYFGGSAEEESSDIFLDEAGKVHIVGYTESANIATTSNAFQKQSGGETDAFFATFDLQGDLVYSTYLGGKGDDSGTGIEVDTAGRRYVAGTTSSEDFPVLKAFESSLKGGSDAFVSVFGDSGSELEYSSYFGGTGADGAIGVGIGATGEAILAGGTSSTDLNIVNGAQNTFGGRSDVFIAELQIDSSTLSYSSYLGGADRERARKVLVDDLGTIVVVGQTSSANFPVTIDLRRGSNVEDDGFIAIINTKDSDLSYSLLSGGTTQDNFEGVAIGWDGSLTVSGVSNSIDYPLVSPIQTEFMGGRFDIVIARYLLGLAR